MLFLFRVDKLIVSSSVQYFRSLNLLQSRTNDHQLQGYCPVWSHNGVRVLVLLYTTRPSLIANTQTEVTDTGASRIVLIVLTPHFYSVL